MTGKPIVGVYKYTDRTNLVITHSPDQVAQDIPIKRIGVLNEV